MVSELIVFLVAMASLRLCSCGSGYIPLWPLLLSVAPTAPPVGTYDIGGHDSSAGAVSFQKAARFKSDGSGTTIPMIHTSNKALPAIINHALLFVSQIMVMGLLQTTLYWSQPHR